MKWRPFNTHAFLMQSRKWDDKKKRLEEELKELPELPSVEPKTKCVAQIKVDTEDIVKRIKEKYQLSEWIPVSEMLPECEQEVLICTEKKLVGRDACVDSIVTPAIYEDGTMLETASMWHWEDIDFAEWDDEEDCVIIPEGWFENRHFNPDDVYNNPVDRKVVAWMPLPEPYKGGDEE